MSLSLFMLVSLIHLVIAIKNPHEKCEFKDTVDLTNHTRYENGSFLYHNILIPVEKWAFYDYRLEFLNKSQQSNLHIRGCICDDQSRRYCVKLCCDRGHFFNETNSSCQKLPQNRKAPTNMEIQVGHVHRNVNVFDHFVHQVGLPCVSPEVLPEKWDLMENGLLFVHGEDAFLDTVSYCITPHRPKGSDKDVLMAMSCPMKTNATMSILLNTYGMASSVVTIVPTILVYLLIKELRRNLRGKLLICYLLSIATAYALLSYINISQTIHGFTSCLILGYSGYFFFMAAFMWLSVLCFDMWSNFKERNIESNVKKDRILFAIYSLYAWGAAGILTSVAAWSQMSDKVKDLYKPGIGVEFCWLDTARWSAFLYFYLPNSIILAFNLIIFTHVTLRIYQVRRDLANMTNQQKSFQENATLIMRLFLIMGISWIMEVISYCLRNYKQYTFVFILTDFCNAIQGVLIFILFVLKPNVIALIKARFQPPKPSRPRFDTTSRETNLSRLTSSTAANAATPIGAQPYETKC